MTKLESLQDIKDTAVRLQETLMGSDIESLRIAMEAFQQLVDRYYQEYEGPYGSETRAERFFKRRQCKREGKGCQVFLYDGGLSLTHPDSRYAPDREADGLFIFRLRFPEEGCINS